MEAAPVSEPLRVPPPAPRAPLRSEHLPGVRGERVVLGNADGWHRGWRAWSDLYTATDGHTYVDVVAERDWWLFELLHPEQDPPVQAWPSGLVWVE